MWILPKQLHTSAYAQDTKALGLDLEAFCRTCEKSLTWRGKDSLSRTWLQRWKRENWMQHLSSRMLKPSLTESFVDAWTSSLEDSRVSHSQLLESVKQLKTPDTSFPTSQMESESANLELCFSKTWQESSLLRLETEIPFSNMSSKNWKDWVTEQRQEYSQRKKSAHLIRESESSSWATPVAMNDGIYADNSPNKNNRHSEGLATQAQNWSTPTVMDTANIQKPRKRNPSGGQKPPLCQEVKNWATPIVGDAHLASNPEAAQKRLAEGKATLSRQAEAKNWPTATARDWKGCGNAINRKDGKHRIDNLEAVIKYGHPDQANPNKNGKSRESWLTPRETMSRDATYDRGKGNLGEVAQGKLNPDWVEHLMGLPVGWTQLPTAWTDSGCSATAL